jgi:hypothetical protein
MHTFAHIIEILGRKTIEFLLITLFMLLAYALHFWESFGSFSEAIFFFSDPDDVRTVSWNTWHFSEQIRAGSNPFYTQHLLYPAGGSLIMHAYTPYFGLLNLGFNNVALSVNTGIALQIVSMGIGYYYLSKLWLKNRFLLVAVAYLAVFNSYYLAKVGVHINLVLMAMVPFIILLFLQSFEIVNGRIKKIRYLRLLAFVVLLCMQFLFDYYAIFFSLAFIFLFLLYHLLLYRYRNWKLWKKTTMVGTLLLLGHVVSRLLRLEGVDNRGAFWAAADIRSLITPTNNSAYLNQIDTNAFPLVVNDQKLFLGYGLLVTFIFALGLFFRTIKGESKAKFLLFATALFLFVAMPEWQLDGKSFFYSFTGIIHFIPFVNNVRAPDRFIAMAFWLAPLFAFYVFEHSKKLKSASLAGIAVCFVFIAFIDHSMAPKQRDYQLETLVTESNSQKAVLKLPFGMRDGHQHFGEFDTYQLLQQQVDGRPLVSAYFSRISDLEWKRARANPLLKLLVDLQLGKEVSEASVNLHKELALLGVSTIEVPRDYYETHDMLGIILNKWVQEQKLVVEITTDMVIFYEIIF